MTKILKERVGNAFNWNEMALFRGGIGGCWWEGAGVWSKLLRWWVNDGEGGEKDGLEVGVA